jgi:ribosomal protein S18 acetylase RimI-like enzyme
MPDPVIRQASITDADTLADFNIEMARETENKRLHDHVIRPGVRALLDNPALGFYVVAETEAGVAGSLMVTTEWSDWRNGIFWWVQSVYVRPEHRRTGIYRALYEFVKELAERDANVCGFRLYVERENTGAQATYKALGMEETAYLMFEELKSGTDYYAR